MKSHFYIINALVLQYLVQADTAKPAHHDNLWELAQTSIDGCYEDDAHTVPVEITDEGYDALLKGSRDAPKKVEKP